MGESRGVPTGAGYFWRQGAIMGLAEEVDLIYTPKCQVGKFSAMPSNYCLKYTGALFFFLFLQRFVDTLNSPIYSEEKKIIMDQLQNPPRQPLIKQFTNFTGSTAGLEKTLRLIQALCQIVSEVTLDGALAKRCLIVKSQLALCMSSYYV